MTMDYSWTTLFLIAPLVFLGGFVDAVAGGGGLIALPAYLIAGFSPYHAIATNKLSSNIGTAVSTGRMIKNRCVDWATAIPSAILAVLGAMAGTRLILSIDERIIRYLLLIILPFAAFMVLQKRDLNDMATVEIDRKKQFLLVLVSSLIVGIYDGFYGPGTGTLLLLCYTQLAKMPLRIASGNVKISNLSSNIGSLIIFLLNGQAVVPIGLAAALFGIVGHYMGAGMLLKNGTKIVRPIIIGVLILLLIRVISDLIGA